MPAFGRVADAFEVGPQPGRAVCRNVGDGHAGGRPDEFVCEEQAQRAAVAAKLPVLAKLSGRKDEGRSRRRQRIGQEKEQKGGIAAQGYA
jgi:hypothetical protein